MCVWRRTKRLWARQLLSPLTPRGLPAYWRIRMPNGGAKDEYNLTDDLIIKDDVLKSNLHSSKMPSTSHTWQNFQKSWMLITSLNCQIRGSGSKGKYLDCIPQAQLLQIQGDQEMWARTTDMGTKRDSSEYFSAVFLLVWGPLLKNNTWQLGLPDKHCRKRDGK